ncbi:antiterminator LoaP [Paenibacillus chitinolyticus]|uniref:antiterminator LoaP n=1 Tax=Paenibacillus chitinolyticus TaxID=79263 RepID=UPI0036257DE8
MKYWYALFVESNQEEIVLQHLNLHFDSSVLNAVVPKRRVPERKNGEIQHVIKKLFPGYVLINCRLTDEIYYKIKRIPRCYRIVHNGKSFNQEECKIEPQEIEPIIKLLGDRDTLEYSSIYLVKSKVLVTSGPLKGLEGIIKKVDSRKNRAKIALNFLGNEKLVDVGVEIIHKLNPRSYEPSN